MGKISHASTAARLSAVGLLVAILMSGALGHAQEPFLSAGDVTAVTQAAAEAIDATTMVIAVTDREGNILGVFRKPDAPMNVVGNFGEVVDAEDFAISLARAGAFFSNDQAPLSSRTVRFISGIHFPPGVSNKPNAALYGIENTNRGCELNAPFDPGKAIPPAKSLGGGPCNSADQSGCGLGIGTGKANVFDSDPNAVNPGGVPIFENGKVVGGIGVTGVSPQQAEFAAFTGSVPGPAFGPVVPPPGVIFLDGVQLPFVDQTTRPPGSNPDPTGFTTGAFVSGPINSPLGAAGVPNGFLVSPRADLAPTGQLTASDVDRIITQARNQANLTRAAIRLPLGSTTRMMIAVAGLDGDVLGVFRMPDATIFSIDVAVAKSRNVVYFSGEGLIRGDLPGVPPGTAVTNRTISFGAQPLYPPGIDGTAPGPFFQLYVDDVAMPCSQGSQPPNLNQDGIVFFPGSVPLYVNGELVGGLGVSGDGVEQDDLVSAAGATGFAPPLAIRADQVFVRDVRLPFLKFPRNPGETIVGGGGGGGGGCFIATAAYGSALAPQVHLLREFRDRYLLPHAAGQAVVELYYTLSPPLAEVIAGSEILRAIVRAGLIPILGWAALFLWYPRLGAGILLGTLGLGAWLALWVVRRRQWGTAPRGAALWRRLAIWGCVLFVLASAALLEAGQGEEANTRARVKVIAEVRLPHARRFALIRDPETGRLRLYKTGEPIFLAENFLPLGKIMAVHDHALVIDLPSGRTVEIPKGTRLPGPHGLIFVRSPLVDTLRFQVRLASAATPASDYSVVDILGRRAILERDSIPEEGQAAAGLQALRGPPRGPMGARASGGPPPEPERSTLAELVNRTPFAEVAPDTWEIPAGDAEELGNRLGPVLAEALASATPSVSIGGGVGLTMSTSLGSGTLDRRGFEIQVASLARRTGLEVGDRILSVNEQPVNSLGGLISIYRQLKRDAALSKVNVVIQRGNDLRTLTYHLR